MCVVFIHTKNGVPDSCRRLMKSMHAAVVSSSIVSHPFLGQRTGVLDALIADTPEATVLGRVVLFARPGVDDAARREQLVEAGEVVSGRPVRELRLLLCVQVVEVAEELVEPVHRGQELVPVPEVVLAELPGRVAERLQQLGDRRILGLQADRRARDSDLAEPGAEDALAGDERRAPGGAALLAVGVREPHPLVRDAVDVRGAVPHQPVAVAAQIGDADVVAPDHEDVRLVGHQAVSPSGSGAGPRTTQRKPRCAIEVSIICGCLAAGR
jgi:hypothetical protein